MSAETTPPDDPADDVSPLPTDPKPLPAVAQQTAGQTPAGQQAGTVPPAAAGNGKTGTVPPAIGSTPPVPGAPGGSKPPIPPAQRIEYSMPTQKKSWLPTPALVKNLGCIFKMLFGFTVLLVIGYVMLMAMNPKARRWALQGSQPGSAASNAGSTSGFAGTGIGGGPGPTPFKVVNQILAIPAQALGKTDDVVKANNARVGLLNDAIADDEKNQKGKAARTITNPFATQSAAPATPAPGAAAGNATTGSDPQAVSASRLLALQEKLSTMPEQSATGTTAAGNGPTAPAQPPAPLEPVTLAGGIVIRSASPEGAPPPSRAFFFWVVQQNISGVFQSSPHRLLLNGRLAYERQEVNLGLGIAFDHLDLENKVIVFKDKTGAVVTRSY